MKNQKIRQTVPSIFTLGNLFCGFLAILNVVEGTGSSYITAAWWIIIAGIFDALDGKIARITGTSSEFGIEFDSLADLVSFGVAPSVLFFSYILSQAGRLGYFLAFCFLAAGAVRLARFNTIATTLKKHYFIGLPIPAAAGILASYVLFSENVWGGIANFDFAVVLVMLTSLAMVSSFKYSLMPKIAFNSAPDILRSIWFVTHILIIIRFPDEVFFPTGILYLLSGPALYFSTPAVNHVMHKVNSR
ncbi:CDP-diacylglycerol--serine O-phosphatidyltransferase [Candidatus Latescibacterota bacterium]